MDHLICQLSEGLYHLFLRKQTHHCLKNWRPITLLNMDYKLLAKTLAMRLKNVLPTIIGTQQTGFMEGRCISENIRTTIDIITSIYKQGKSALVVSVDYEKCFDRIEHGAIQGALKYFGFSSQFADWINVFFTDFEICTCNAGYTSDFFKKTRGVNQGCPISPYPIPCL